MHRNVMLEKLCQARFNDKGRKNDINLAPTKYDISENFGFDICKGGCSLLRK